jgi:hypothetical protein
MKKNIIIVIGFIFVFSINGFSQVSINETCADPDASAILDVQSTSAGLLVPRMSTSQMNAISNPATSLVIFNTTENEYYYYTTAWTPLGHADGDAFGVDGEDQAGVAGRTGRVGIGTNTPDASSMLHVAGYIWQTNTGHSVFIGECAGEDDDLSDNYNIFVGYHAGMNNTDGYNNIALGTNAYNTNTGGDNNVSIGRDAGAQMSGGWNTAVGAWANRTGNGGWINVAIGDSAMANNHSSYNTAAGKSALANNGNGSSNVAIGHNAILLRNGGSHNTAFGASALESLTDGGHNSAFGYNAGSNLVDGDYNIFIGANVQPLSTVSSHGMYLGDVIFGNLSNGNTGLGTNTPSERLEVNGAMRIRNVSSTDPTPHEGNIIFDGVHFMGYINSAWVQLDNTYPCP